MEVALLTISSLDTEEFLVLSGQTDTGDYLDDEICRKLLSLPANVDLLNASTVPAFNPFDKRK